MAASSAFLFGTLWYGCLVNAARKTGTSLKKTSIFDRKERFSENLDCPEKNRKEMDPDETLIF